MTTTLLLINMYDLWNSSKRQYGKKARVDFNKIIEKAKWRKNDVVKAFAFVVAEPDKNQSNLVRKLQDIGIEVVEVKDQSCVVEVMRSICSEQRVISTITTVVVAGTDVELVPILDEANYEGCNTCVISFGNYIAKELADTADNIRLFTRSDIIF